MTQEQCRKTKTALRQYGRRGRIDPDGRAWRIAIDQALRYYEQRDPVRARLLCLRFIERRSEDYALQQLHIGHTTFQKAQQDVLSTVAVLAAQNGAEV